MKSFLDTYVRTPSEESTEEGLKTLWGAPYIKRKGYPLMYTMCREEPLSSEVDRFLHSAFYDDFAFPRSQLKAQFGMATSLEEPMFGLDRVIPLQFLQHAISSCVESSYLDGPDHVVPLDLDPELESRYPFKMKGDATIPAKAHPVCEPGNKVRWVTMEEDFVTVALQPLAHWLAGTIGRYPSLVSAFSRSWKGWDVASILQRKEGLEHDESYGFGTFDLTGASNNLNRNLLRVCGEEVINAFSEGTHRSFLLRLLDLALLDRVVEVSDCEDSASYMSFRATNGVMMGNPVTKELLCLSSAVLHSITMKRSKDKCPFNLIAGDDIFVYSSKKFFNDLLNTHRDYGNIINMTKTCWSKTMAFFAEEVLRLVPEGIGVGKLPNQVDYEELTLHPDVIKLRLLSPFGIQSTMQDSSFKNPAIGKGRSLKGMLDWHPRKDTAWVATRRFLRWMADFIRDDPLVFLPSHVGGTGSLL